MHDVNFKLTYPRLKVLNILLQHQTLLFVYKDALRSLFRAIPPVAHVRDKGVISRATSLAAGCQATRDRLPIIRVTNCGNARAQAQNALFERTARANQSPEQFMKHCFPCTNASSFRPDISKWSNNFFEKKPFGKIECASENVFLSYAVQHG